jgi:hypothetical protein
MNRLCIQRATCRLHRKSPKESIGQTLPRNVIYDFTCHVSFLRLFITTNGNRHGETEGKGRVVMGQLALRMGPARMGIH